MNDADLQAIVDGVLNSIIGVHSDELQKLAGLNLNTPMIVTQASRIVATISLDLSGDGVNITTVERQ